MKTPLQTLKLILAVLLLAAVGIGGFEVWEKHYSPQAMLKQRPYFDLSTKELIKGMARYVDWQGERYFVWQRTPVQLEALPRLRAALRDPDSKLTPPPHPSLANEGRSSQADILVVKGTPEHTNCKIVFMPAMVAVPQAEPWFGGFFETCHGSAYDLAGRVYAVSPRSAKNLQVLHYEIEGERLRVFLK
jgi:ubiquinol-cytochrome c reductase iron-sulfur subunit